MVSKKVFLYCKVVLATSAVWFMLDVFLLNYYSDCGVQPPVKCPHSAGAAEPSHKFPTQRIIHQKPEGILQKLINYARGPNHPGEGGTRVEVPKDLEKEAVDKFKINQFNLVASDMVSLNRTLRDYRLAGCKKKFYTPYSNLPTASIIIVFHNEAWSTLLRTVWSVINRIPREVLREILLVDDASERDFLKQPLDEYAETLPVPTRVLRARKRAGLIRARLRGAENAKGDVLLFLDAHCECTEGWLPPLLNEIKLNRKSVVCPIIDVISDNSFEYITGSDMTWGGFNWRLNFRWYGVPRRELDRRNGDRTLPLRSPTMAGGLFAIERKYFYEVGSYDQGMDIWGGENLEMSFRVWMCGGQILIVTCSRVGHVFRKVSPYSWPGGVVNILNKNSMRTVEVWFDEYKPFYYKINPSVRNTAYGDVSERTQLREKLGCKSFKWYLENIYPESHLPKDFYSIGEVKNPNTGICLDSMGRKANELIGASRCHGMGGNQVFSYTGRKHIQSDELCLDTDSLSNPLRLVSCHGDNINQQWSYNPNDQHLVHDRTGHCLTVGGQGKTADEVWLSPCSNPDLAPNIAFRLENYHSKAKSL